MSTNITLSIVNCQLILYFLQFITMMFYIISSYSLFIHFFQIHHFAVMTISTLSSKFFHFSLLQFKRTLCYVTVCSILPANFQVLSLCLIWNHFFVAMVTTIVSTENSAPCHTHSSTDLTWDLGSTIHWRYISALLMYFPEIKKILIFQSLDVKHVFY